MRFRRWKARTSSRQVTSDSAFDWPEEDPDEFGIAPERRAKRRLKIAAYDFGMKWNILRRLSAHGCDVRVYPGGDARGGAAGDRVPTACS